MKSVYELQAEEVEVLGKITELEKSAKNEVDIRELKRLRKRSFEIQDDLLIARNKERLAQKEVSIQHMREYEGKNQEGYAEVMQLATECLPKLREVDKLLRQLTVSQNKIVYSGREAGDIARRVNLQPGEDVTLNLKPHVILTTVNPNATIPKNLEALELLLKDNGVEEVNEDATLPVK